jgi:hypothetical protein
VSDTSALAVPVRRWQIDAAVTGMVAVGNRIAVAAGDGGLRWFDPAALPKAVPAAVAVHDGAILTLAAGKGEAMTGGDDGWISAVRPGEAARRLFKVARGWVNHLGRRQPQRPHRRLRRAHRPCPERRRVGTPEGGRSPLDRRGRRPDQGWAPRCRRALRRRHAVVGRTRGRAEAADLEGLAYRRLVQPGRAFPADRDAGIRPARLAAGRRP